MTIRNRQSQATANVLRQKILVAYTWHPQSSPRLTPARIRDWLDKHFKLSPAPITIKRHVRWLRDNGYLPRQ